MPFTVSKNQFSLTLIWKLTISFVIDYVYIKYFLVNIILSFNPHKKGLKLHLLCILKFAFET
jgi:hypothetical protein